MEAVACETIDADVLILGGGFAGSWAALRASQLGQKVVLVDKAFVSRSGASPISGGITTCPTDDDDLDAWAEEFISRGSYMCDQDWTYQLLEGQRERVKDLIAWDVPISRDENGNIRRFASRGMLVVRGMQYKPKVAMRELRRRILAAGGQIVDRVCIVDLLTSDGQWPTKGAIVGAAGFHVHDGRLVILRGRRTIMATGMISMKGTHGVDNDTGDGVAMAFRAGVRLVDMEFTFGGTFSVLMKHMHFPSYNVAVGQGARLINALGERFMERYDPVRLERSELSFVVAAFAKEMLDGRGPVFMDLRNVNPTYWADIASLNRGNSVLMSNHIPDPRRNPLLIEPAWGLWVAGRAGLQIDIDCRASLPGLLAAGGVAKNNATGTHASAGAPTSFCFVSGWRAGEVAALESRQADFADIPPATIEHLRERAFGALRRRGSEGMAGAESTADALHDRLSRLEASLLNGLVLSAPKLEGMIDIAKEVAADVETTGASDLHDLVKLHEARSVAQCASLVYESALDRTESREQFYREDFPNVDDDNWFCWHGVTHTADGTIFDREPIPLHNARFLPPGKTVGLSPIAAIMANKFAPEMAQ